jgi:hypothetical protein
MGEAMTASQRGRGRPSEGERVEVRLPADLLAELDAAAAELGWTRAVMIRTALRGWQCRQVPPS